MAGTEALVEQGTEGEDYFRAEAHGKQLIVPIRKDPDESYHADPQIRARQLVFEGKIGGAGRGQGRKRQPRASEAVAKAIAGKADKIIDAIDSALDDNNPRTRLQGADMALRIENDEAELSVKEDELDLEKSDRGELIATLFALVGDPHTQAALQAAIDIPEEDIEEIIEESEEITVEQVEAAERAESSSAATSNGPNGRTSRRNGRGKAAGNHRPRKNPFTEAANRRSSE